MTPGGDTGGSAKGPEQLLADAAAALQRGDRTAALDAVVQAEAVAPHDPHVKMQKALIHRIGGALPAALAALDEALALDPYNFLALLSKGAVVEKMSGARMSAIGVGPARDQTVVRHSLL